MNNFSLLEALRPPPGYVTDAALGTSYSADLISCMVALTHLGADGADALRYQRLEALRALERLRPRVRIAIQQGRLAWHGRHRRVLPLLDRILRPIAVNGNEASFHPKVWAVRQIAIRGDSASEPPAPTRWVLMVGSRNLTGSTAWDFGVALLGTSRPNKLKRTARLSGLNRFIAGTCRGMGEPSFAKQLEGLEEVFWELPEGCSGASFLGSIGELEDLRDVPASLVGTAKRALVVSPFLDVGMVRRLAAECGSQTVIGMVAGLPDLERVAQSEQEALSRLNPKVMAVAGHQPEAPGVDRLEEELCPVAHEDEDANEDDAASRGLHAKFLLAEDGEKTRLLVGSHNLTSRAWSGRNWEASLLLTFETTELSERLWDWWKERTDFSFPELVPGALESPEATLESLRNTLSAAVFELEDPSDGEPSTLRVRAADPKAEAALMRAMQDAKRLGLRIARMTRPHHVAHWHQNDELLLLAPCSLPERTAFLIVFLGEEEAAMSWVQKANATPEPGAERDRAALVEMLGLEGLVRLLDLLLLDRSGGTTSDHDDDESVDQGMTRRWNSQREPSLSLEVLLRRAAKMGTDSDAARSLKEAGLMLERHRDAFRNQGRPEELAEFESLCKFWQTLQKGLRLAS